MTIKDIAIKILGVMMKYYKETLKWATQAETEKMCASLGISHNEYIIAHSYLAEKGWTNKMKDESPPMYYPSAKGIDALEGTRDVP